MHFFLTWLDDSSVSLIANQEMVIPNSFDELEDQMFCFQSIAKCICTTCHIGICWYVTFRLILYHLFDDPIFRSNFITISFTCTSISHHEAFCRLNVVYHAHLLYITWQTTCTLRAPQVKVKGLFTRNTSKWHYLTNDKYPLRLLASGIREVWSGRRSTGM